MAPAKQPKVFLFDIGGVCVVSPFQAILDYELSLGIPPGWVNYSISKSKPNGFWHRLETGSIPLDAKFYEGFNKDLHNEERWKTFYRDQQANNPKLPKETPPLPTLDGAFLFHEMMSVSRSSDPWMFPALKALKSSGKYIVAALSNTIVFPPDHEFAQEDFFDDPVRSVFDVFISSAHVGLRKPDPAIYRLAVEKADEFAKANASTERGRASGWGAGIEAGDIVFLDDIGENLKAGKAAGFGTIKVSLGKAFEAVDELEKLTGLKLAGDHPRIAIKPKLEGTRAKI